jgi:hypothetical protein
MHSPLPRAQTWLFSLQEAAVSSVHFGIPSQKELLLAREHKLTFMSDIAFGQPILLARTS